MQPSALGIERHYRQGNLLERLLAALQEAGHDVEYLRAEDLAPVDEFHTRGRRATRELSELAQFLPHQRVLDVGSGLGGPARYLASSCGCDVTGIDLMTEFCEAANELSRRARLAGSTRFLQGNALALPFPSHSFDAVWTVQAQMNIADKRGFYGEIARVLRPGGRFVFQELCAGDRGPLHYPVPWASVPEQSFLIAPDALRDLLCETDLRELRWVDNSAESIAWRTAQAARAKAAVGTARSPLGMHLVMGERAAEKSANSGRNFSESRTRSVQGLFEKPA
ncbi:MAG TPA: class I SAM-dependent methyltransferase [bacterium]|nr:class I SAM-dependent methyltransferase [bacterium]